jgi:hypothetical protein
MSLQGCPGAKAGGGLLPPGACAGPRGLCWFTACAWSMRLRWFTRPALVRAPAIGAAPDGPTGIFRDAYRRLTAALWL